MGEYGKFAQSFIVDTFVFEKTPALRVASTTVSPKLIALRFVSGSLTRFLVVAEERFKQIRRSRSTGNFFRSHLIMMATADIKTCE